MRGKRVTTVKEVRQLAKEKRALITQGRGEIKPAAFYLNYKAECLDGMFDRGLYVYEKTVTKKLVDENKPVNIIPCGKVWKVFLDGIKAGEIRYFISRFRFYTGETRVFLDSEAMLEIAEFLNQLNS